MKSSLSWEGVDLKIGTFSMFRSMSSWKMARFSSSFSSIFSLSI
uniref:Uncharacterized protein n=1 Tax=Lepeophtheirus salmonis TaxID=72036 RepID=A0A0K2UQ11_LEPSM